MGHLQSVQSVLVETDQRGRARILFEKIIRPGGPAGQARGRRGQVCDAELKPSGKSSVTSGFQSRLISWRPPSRPMTVLAPIAITNRMISSAYICGMLKML